MSTIKISFQLQTLDFSPLNRGQIDIVFNDGSIDITLTERLTTGTSVTNYFTEVGYSNTDVDATETQQASNFANAFNRDYKSVGGSAKNLTASVDGNEVTITAKSGTFVNGDSSYSGNVLIVGGFEVDNTVVVDELVLVVEPTETGDCDTINYTITSRGGVANYEIKNNSTVENADWNGDSFEIPLTRGIVHSFEVTDTEGNYDIVVVNVPRKLAIGEFKQQVTSFENYSDVLIESVNPVTGTTPLEYSITDTSQTTGQNYKTSNSFTGIQAGIYNLFVKDKFGCEIYQTITISEFQDATSTESVRVFEVSNANSLIMSPCVSFDANTKKHFNNTNSQSEFTSSNHKIRQYFDKSDGLKGTQFKSSYPYHVATLEFCDGTKQDITPITIQENLGSVEKVDCVLFAVDGKTGVYFNGGNSYESNTDTVIDASPYQPNTYNSQTFLPDWAEEGQLVYIEDVGSMYIDSVAYDDTIGGYFILDFVTTTQTESKVQITYNIQDYNLFECYINIDDIDDTAKLTIEKGYSFDEIDGDPWVSEIIKTIDDTDRYILLQWSHDKNRGGMVFQSGIECLNRIEGKFRPVWEGEADTALSDTGRSSLKQSSYQDYRLEFESLSAKQVDKLNIISGLDGGSFKVNGIGVIRKEFPDIEPLEESNRYSWAVSLSYSGDQLSVDSDEIVLEVSTGVEGGGTSAKTSDVFPPIRPLSVDGEIISVNGKIITLS